VIILEYYNTICIIRKGDGNEMGESYVLKSNEMGELLFDWDMLYLLRLTLKIPFVSTEWVA